MFFQNLRARRCNQQSCHNLNCFVNHNHRIYFCSILPSYIPIILSSHFVIAWCLFPFTALHWIRQWVMWMVTIWWNTISVPILIWKRQWYLGSGRARPVSYKIRANNACSDQHENLLDCSNSQFLIKERNLNKLEQAQVERSKAAPSFLLTSFPCIWNLRVMVEYQWFFTSLSERPGSCLEMSVHCQEIVIMNIGVCGENERAK